MIKAVIFDYDWVLSRYYVLPQKKLFKLAAQLRAKGLKTGVLSNRIFPLTWMARRSDALKGFDAVIFCRKFHAPKPDPKSYQAIIEQLGVKPEECLFIDNNQDNVAAAQTIGMRAIKAHGTAETIAKISAALKT